MFNAVTRKRAIPAAANEWCPVKKMCMFKLESIPDYIVAAATLHNIAILLKQGDFLGPEDDYTEDQPEQTSATGYTGSGNVYRAQIVQNFF
uniref:DDE Tnp4 domain-containing protein n=1 Tax=Ditylenchus dipsaci TaxID=166011 RepID=A0A915D4E1_9BILA